MKDQRVMVVAEDALQKVPQVFAELFGGRVPLLVADRTTWQVAGGVLETLFHTQGFPEVSRFIFPDVRQVYADQEHVETVRNRLEATGSVAVAVGAGTINDIVKLASHEVSQPYLCVPTAPSVDGYSSPNAAITVSGFKKSIPCPPPAAIVADVTVLRGAPQSMAASGYGDLVAKVTGGADWIIADALGIEPIDPLVWDRVQIPLRSRIARPRAVAQREADAVDALFTGLVEVGLAMLQYGDSRPASGAEHLLSHVWEMDHLEMAGNPVSHGFKVALGTLIATAVMTWLSELSVGELKESFLQHPPIPWERRLEEILNLLPGHAIDGETVEAAKAKFLEGGELEKRRSLMLDQWETLTRRIADQLIPFDHLREMLVTAGCPVEPADIGLTRDAVARGICKAQLIRMRYTSLDLAYETGTLGTVVERIVRTDRWFSRFA